jgi:cell division septal protein FtsQ
MEFKVKKSDAAKSAGITPPSDRNRHKRRKASQKLGRGQTPSRRLVAAIRIIGKLGVPLMISIFLLSVFIYAFSSNRFRLRNITVYGCKEIDCRRLETIVRSEFSANILRIDLRRLQNRLEKETWIKHIEIRRVLPSDFIFIIQERVPSVILEVHGELMIADSDGVLLDKYDSKYGKLDVPVFKGVLGENIESYQQRQEENTARVHQALFMLSEIASGSPSYTRNISEVDISDQNNLKLLLVDDTAEILLGNRDYLKRFRKFMNNIDRYQELKAQHSDFIIDPRFDHFILYRPRHVPVAKDAGANQ